MKGTPWSSTKLLLLLPLPFTLFVGAMPTARDFRTEFSAAIGYTAPAMMGLLFGSTARFRLDTERSGENISSHFHRKISLIAVGRALAHPNILFVVRLELLALLNFIDTPRRARFAAISTYSLIAIVGMVLWRTRVNVSHAAPA